MRFWRAFNTALYGAWYRVRNRRRRAGPVAAGSGAPAATSGRPRVLHVAWGRIGDAVLATGILKHFRAAFADCEIVHAGRPETEPVVRPHVDRFVALDRIPADAYAVVLGDVHLFYGGLHALGALLERLPAQRTLLYEGYHRGPSLAPVRPWPRGAEIVPHAPVPHVLEHQAHYFAEATRRLLGAPFPVADTRPALALDVPEETKRRDADVFAWQPLSNNRKKDYPLARWRDVLARFPDARFVALGTAAAAAAVDGLGLRNVENRCGRTSLEEAVATIAAARGFLGPDSGLTHVAACLGRPTVCVTQNATLGAFFPYPSTADHDAPNLRTVWHPGYEACAGCFMTCEHEPIVATWLRGAKCLRELPPDHVAAAVAETLLAPAHARTR